MMKIIYKNLIIIFLFFIISASPAWALFAYTADSYEKKPSGFDSIGKVAIVPPKVVSGNYQLIGHNTPVSENSPAYQLVEKSVLLGATNIFLKRGYAVSEAPASISSEEWEDVLKFTDAGKPSKRKMLPYLASFKSLQAGEVNTDAFVFFQIYGEFGAPSSSSDTIKAQQATEITGAVITGALTGSAFIGPTATSEYDYKISIFDAHTGELLWFKEGHGNKTDIGSVGQFSREIENLLADDIPKNKKPLPAEQKFKRRRSEQAV